MIAERAIDWANGRAPDRIVAVGRLAVRPLRYVAEYQPLAGPTIAGLHVHVQNSAEHARFHVETGIYGFLKLRPGSARIEVTDPAGRWFPAARDIIVPDRSAILAAATAGGTPPVDPPGPDGRPAWIADIALRPTISAPATPGLTILWGVVREMDGTPVPLTRIMIDSVASTRIVTHADRSGTYIVALPAERTDPFTLTSVFDRAMRVHVPGAALTSALRTMPRFVSALPADLDTLDPDAIGSPFIPRAFSLVPAGGAPRSAPLPVQAAARSRWDIHLLP